LGSLSVASACEVHGEEQEDEKIDDARQESLSINCYSK
jgi:hypothetical protein